LDLTSTLIKIKTETIISAISASFLIAFTIGFFGPATLYYTNFFEYSNTFSDFFPYLISLTIIFGISLTLLSLLFKGKIQQKIICLVFALGLLFYIQGNILVWDYGILNGQEIIWNNYLINGLIDSIIWIAIIGLSLLKSDKIFKFIPVASIFLLIIQMGGLAAVIHFAPGEPQWKTYSFADGGPKFEFSENSNVIVILLDTFQSDVFQEIIDENIDGNDRYKNMFAGFTYYRNAVGGYPTTFASIPLILTGKYYNNSVPFEDFVQSSYESSSLPKILKENGYNVDVYGSTRLIYPDKNLESNVIKNSLYYENTTPLIRLTLFRHAPHFLKEATSSLLIDQGTNQEISADRQFNDQLLETFRLNNISTFKFYHLTGPHPPFRLNEQLEYEELPNNRSGYKEQSKASLRIVGNLLEKLKENKIFDKSIIVVVGDHGMQNGWYGLNNSQVNSTDQISFVSQGIVTGGIPLMLVKPLNSTYPLAISDAPVSLSDIPKSVASELNLSNNFTGESIFTVRDSDKRNLTFYQHTWVLESWFGQYLPSMHEYIVNNFSWDTSSWQPTYRVYTPMSVELRPPPQYNPGTLIKFGKDQQSQDFTNSGWSPEDGFVWSDGKSSTIAFSMNRSNSTLMSLQITASPFIVQQKHEFQRVTIYLNKYELGNYSFIQHELQNLEFKIPSNYLNEQEQYLTFNFPDAISPSDLGISSDPRNLAIALSSFSLTEVNNNQIEYTRGWYPLENWSGIPTRWMPSNASLIIYSNQNRTSMLNMQLSSFYRPRTLDISTEGQSRLQVVVPSGFETGFVKIRVPVDLHQGENTILFNVSEGCQKPSDIPELNYSDSRCLSMSIQNITLT